MLSVQLVMHDILLYWIWLLLSHLIKYGSKNGKEGSNAAELWEKEER
jgi:hypothetical protein